MFDLRQRNRHTFPVLTFFCLAVAALCPSPADGTSVDTIITPDSVEYVDMLMAEAEALEKAAGDGGTLVLLARFSDRRINEMEAVMQDGKPHYIPQLAAAYTKSALEAMRMLALAARLKTLKEDDSRQFVTLIFPHANRLASLIHASPDKHVSLLEKAQSVAKKLQTQALKAWRESPTRPVEGTSLVNVRIDVRITEVGTTDRMQVGLGVKAKKRPVSVSAKKGVLSRNGLSVSYGTATVKAALSAQASTMKTNRSTNQFIVTLSGHPATINIGKVRVKPVTVMLFTRDGAESFSVTEYAFEKVGASLEVLPVVTDSATISVRLTPRLTYYDKGRKTMKLHELSTTVAVRSGQSIVIGGMDTRENTVGNMLFASQRGSSTVFRQVVLTPRILPRPAGYPR